MTRRMSRPSFFTAVGGASRILRARVRFPPGAEHRDAADRPKRRAGRTRFLAVRRSRRFVVVLPDGRGDDVNTIHRRTCAIVRFVDPWAIGFLSLPLPLFFLYLCPRRNSPNHPNNGTRFSASDVAPPTSALGPETLRLGSPLYFQKQ